jgi:hypothetical protein
MKYVVVIEFDDSTPELTPRPEDVRQLVAHEMNREYAEVGYRTTTIFDEPDGHARRHMARDAAGIESLP